MLSIITRHTATDLPKTMLILWLLLSTPLMAADNNQLIQDLTLVPAQPPASLFTSSQSLTDSDSQWYRLDLSPALTEDSLVVFNHIPAKRLDVFIPNDGGYRLKKMGIDSTSVVSSAIKMPPGGAEPWYLRHTTTPLVTLQPQLWPASLYTAVLQKQRLAVSTVQTLLIVALIGTLMVTLTRRTPSFRPLIGHIVAAIALVLMWQGDLFRLLSWPEDPARWVMFMTTLVLVTGTAIYRHLLLADKPVTSNAMLALSVLTVATATYGIVLQVPLAMSATGVLLLTSACWIAMVSLKDQPKTALPLVLTTLVLVTLGFSPVNLPSLPELLLLGLHAALLPLLCWSLYQGGQRGRAINVTSAKYSNRRIFSDALRQHLANPDTPLAVSDLKQLILTTAQSALPATPAMIVHQQQGEWHTTPGEGADKVASKLNSRLPAIETDLLRVICNDAQTNINFKYGDGTVYWLLPLSIEADDKVLLVLAPHRRQRTDGNWRIACDISSHASTVFQVNRQSLFWQREASLDGLTGVLNRRAFYREAETAINLCTAASRPCCVLFMDLDNFKQLNDQHGHSAGDEALQQTARLFRKALRQEDLLGRFGGEEFVVLLPETEPWQAFGVAERIRKAVAREQQTHGTTVSIGISALSADVDSLDKMISEADAAMYLAKQQGKNRTTISPLLPDMPASQSEESV